MPHLWRLSTVLDERGAAGEFYARVENENSRLNIKSWLGWEMRVRLRPGLRVLWRNSETIQLGWGGEPRVIFSNPSRDDLKLLEQLHFNGVTNDRSNPILRSLAEHNLLLPASSRSLTELEHSFRFRLAPDAAMRSMTAASGDGWEHILARTRATVAVRGLGRTGGQLVHLLAHCGIRELIIWDDAPVLGQDVSPGAYSRDDLMKRRDHALRDGLARQYPDVSVSVDPEGRADLVIFIGHYLVDSLLLDDLMRNDVPHLAITLCDNRASIGPIVEPGKTPCLRCVEMHLTDADPAWPMLGTQLLDLKPEEIHPEESALASLTASVALGMVLSHIAGSSEAHRGLSTEVSLADFLPAARSWQPHPDCGCLLAEN